YSMALKVGTGSMTRHEVEFPIDAEKGQRMLDLLCVEPPIQKTRHVIAFAGKDWEVDVFDGANGGLIVAEVELTSEDEHIALPPWLGPEVTGDARFFNAALSQAPFSGWGLSYEDLLAEKNAG
ncbi:MAG: adenylate cyclase, partial [Alphaproteobacteria bacterium]|nr:adenylate cyclase [Alphaproteobacteria bacterium]